MALTPSEALVEKLCLRSFLSLWSFANPRMTSGKELCDMLVVCDPDVLIFSVKQIALTDADDPVAAARWHKRAITESAKQLRGAARHLQRLKSVIHSDGTTGLPLPPLDRRRVHRILVALGSSGDVLFSQGDDGHGFVHAFDDLSLETSMGELDTIADFVQYLEAKAALINAGTTPIIVGGEQQLLALYLHNNRSFPVGANVLVANEGMWEEVANKAEWKRRKEADKISYLWDGLIERVSHDIASSTLEFGTFEGAERVTRIMARESRFARRILAEGFAEFMKDAGAKKTRSRIADSPSGVRYVFLATAHDEPRDLRSKELMLRCFVARSFLTTYAPVVGLATEHIVSGAGHSIDAGAVFIEHWTNAHQEKVDGIQRDLGYFQSPVFTKMSVLEYPSE
jgi:hypothetical protein